MTSAASPISACGDVSMNSASLGLPVDARLVLDICRRSIEPHQRYDTDVWDELHGIAEGAGLSDEMILICNGLTDIKDAVQVVAGGGSAIQPADTAGCTAWLAAPEATEAEIALAGQTWDMHAAAAEFMVIVRRKPDRGPATISMTTAGCLSLVGINSAGIAIGNNNLRPRDARPGVMYLAMIHNALGQTHSGRLRQRHHPGGSLQRPQLLFGGSRRPDRGYRDHRY